MEKLRESIEKLSGSDAKSLLLNVMYRLELVKKEDLQDEMINELLSLSNDLSDSLQKEVHYEMDETAVHIISGESPAGSLRIGLSHENRIIGFPDFFAEGPVWKIHTEQGHTLRYEWLRDHINYEMDYIEEEYINRFSKTLATIEEIPANIPIVLWTANNADEQTGLRYFLYLLREKKNDIYIINTPEAFETLYGKGETQFRVRHSGELASYQFKEIYQTNLGNPLTTKEKEILRNEWLLLSEEENVLRIWKGGSFQVIEEDHFDSMIIDAVRRLQREQEATDFILAARVIGEILFQSEHLVSHSYLEYRIRYLVYNGTFKIRGIPKSMRHYHVQVS
ncbi:DUF1835 domain-containing protein [Planococcus sp. S3-L1]|uniref:DUF1835 domain-containing protein n=1 Tax=Planococcus sp. S3-L1 TaxID=3046200 RepID=UPI0024BA89E8|nr:DUF1835 domain-containing protein [Planococcus sp. S3-L1]MDJ0333417.1 DUF1835 domain-containing protein [Planococcus sp. S3-L1]